MNLEQFKGIAERVATIGITYLVAKGYVPSAVSPDLIGAIGMLASVGWGWYVNTHSSLSTATQAVKP